MSGTEVANVTINGAQVQAAKGRLLIDVAEEMGIFIPRFCYHPGMKSVAVCRMCLVQIEGQRKLLPACATPVDEGMTVNTVDEEAVDAQRGMLEFLLINHPLDCPICDRGGECPLQDQTYRHGPGASRYLEPKRSYEKALEISDLVVLDRERCVLCWRCVRFCDEIAGDRFIQLVDRGPGTQILTFSDEPFNSYFSGNTIQICPVGALTSLPYRFASRPWDLQTAPSICAYCSVGCPITNESRSGELVRCQALPNENVNDFWICDKGRFGYHYVSSHERLDTPLVRKDDEFVRSSWGEALQLAAAQLGGKERVGVIAGGHLTTEDAFAVSKLARSVIETPHIDSRVQDAGAPYELFRSLNAVAGSTATLNDLEDAKSIVWIGPDPKETLPVLFLRLRKAVLDRGAHLTVVSVRAISLDGFADRVVRPSPAGNSIASVVADESTRPLQGPIVVCWGPAHPGRDERETVAAILDLARDHDAKVLVCPPHAGSQGLIDMGVHPLLNAGYADAASEGRDTRAILEAAVAGELDALLLVGADPIADFPDAALAQRALESKVFTIAIELFPTETALHADIVFPSVAYAEREGTFTNLERRLQKLERLMVPPGAARDPWKICASFAQVMGQEWNWHSFEDVWADIKREVPTHREVRIERLSQEAPLPAPFYEPALGVGQGTGSSAVGGPGGQYPKGHRAGAPFQTGQNWPLSWELRAFEAKQRPGFVPALPAGPSSPGTELTADPAGEPDAPSRASSASTRPSDPPLGDHSFSLYCGRLIYDEGAMVSRTAALRGIQRKAFVEMNEYDAKRLEIADGDEVMVAGNGFEVRLPAVVADIAEGAVFIPYDQEGLQANRLMGGVDPVVEVTRA
ncbi:MAG: NADH-quinone oxidoreductase subunit NuoG [Actinomycetota bacterium]|nr:NADH-quinone oxidoreductase subunit NuoG [Actinomycetota bacterium]